MRSAVIVAAGNSARFGSDKLLAPLYGKCVLWHSVAAFLPYAEQIIVVVNKTNAEAVRQALADFKVSYVEGGSTRSKSVLNGLATAQGDTVAIHDGARPYVKGELIERCFAEAEQFGSCVPVIGAVDSVYLKGIPVNRDGVVFAQTPQVFDRIRLLQAYDALTSVAVTDDGEVWYRAYGDLHTTSGDKSNVKITYADDLADSSIGYGYDIHQIEQGLTLHLCGVQIDCGFGLKAHSDGDVALHAVMDALLSACGLPDIGHLFPVDDAKYDNIDSKLLLKDVMSKLYNKGYEVASLSIAIVAEKPKLAPLIERMKITIANILHVAPQRISISATTAEGVGEIGNGCAIAARAVALLKK